MKNKIRINSAEVLNLEQLDKVSGGNTSEFLEISHLLGKYFGYKRASFRSHKEDQRIVRDWLKNNLGIDAELHSEILIPRADANEPNKYYHMGKEISHDKVMYYLNRKAGLDV